MLYPEKLKDNEYVALFFMKTDKNGNVVIGRDGKKDEFHKYVKSFDEYKYYLNP